MKNSYHPTVVLLVLILYWSSSALAQNKMASIIGFIKTSDGKPASHISVTLKNSIRFTQTNQEGEFVFKNVAPGHYVLKISALGLVPLEKQVAVDAESTVSLSFSIAESATQLNEVKIEHYKSPNNKSVSLGKVAIPVKDLPQAVQVIGTQVIEDQQINRLGDVMKNVNGVALGANRGSVGENFFARGYSLGANNVLKNGARTTIGGSPEASTLESVEVLKGSAALLYGGVSGGAVVNMVTKKPKFEYGGEIAMRAGSYDLYKPIADVYGPISKKLAFRVIGTYERAGSFRDHVDSKRIYVNPSLLYKISDRTEILVQGDYLKSDFTPDFGIGTVGNQISPLGRNVFVNTVWAYNKTNTGSAQANINHRFSENWKLNIIASYQGYTRNYFGAERPFGNASGVIKRDLTRSKINERSFNEQLNLNGKFETFGIKHTVAIGADADQSHTTNGAFYYDGNPKTTTYSYGNVNLLDPSTINARTDMPQTNLLTQTVVPLFRMGSFVQDLVELSAQFKVLVGVRWSFQKTPRTVTTNVETGAKTISVNSLNKSKVEHAFSPKFALIYQPIKSTSVYVSYANNFISNTGTDIFLAPLDPSIVDQYEVGLKNDFLEGRLVANVTWYKIKNNKFAQMAQLKADGTANADATIKEFSGATASDGIEIDLTGTLVKGLNFMAGYSYNYMRYTNTLPVTGIIEGERLVGTTKNTGNASLFYTFQNGGAKGLKLGASAYYTGNRLGGRNTTKNNSSSGIIPLGAFTTVDLSAGYSWSKFSILAKLANITNELNYFVHENYSVNPIPPRQFVATLSYRF